jgi:putative ABC transport system permease protein
MFGQIIREAAGNLMAAKQRTLLALIGIVIGAGSVIAMINVGQMVQQQALLQFQALGPDLVNITIESGMSMGRPGGGMAGLGGGDRAGLPPDVALELIRGTPGLTVASPLITANASMVRDGRPVHAQMMAGTSALLDLTGVTMAEGRFISDFDDSEPFIAGARGAMERTFGEMNKPPENPLRVGEALRVGGSLFTIIGTFDAGGYNPLLGFQPSNALFIPLLAARRVSDRPLVSQIIGRMGVGVTPPDIEIQMRDRLLALGRTERASVRSAEELMQAMQQQMRLFTLLLGAVGSISLVVGGVGVMNIMLVSVMERRREIGLRLAIGARPREITWLFLIESILLSALGGGLGLVLGLGASYLFGSLTNTPFFPSQLAALVGVLVSASVGVFFGYYPARRASRLDPIEALRSE